LSPRRLPRRCPRADVCRVIGARAQRGHCMVVTAAPVRNGELPDELGMHFLQVGGPVFSRVSIVRHWNNHTGERIVVTRCGQSYDSREIRRGSVAPRQCRQVPTPFDRLEDGGVIERRRIGRHPEDSAGGDSRRDQHGRDTDAKAPKGKTELAGRAVWRHCAGRWRHMIVTGAMLVIGDNQQRLVPIRAVAQGVIDVV
jgi:hypothetical protein